MKPKKAEFIAEQGFLRTLGKTKSIASYLKLLNILSDRWNGVQLWFRGVAKSSYRPVPSIYRKSIYRNWRYTVDDANELFDSFVHRAKAYFSQIKRQYSGWEWYHLMQHYGVPTRLLDWTEGSLIALYFALREISSRETPSIWVLDPYWLNKISVQHSAVLYTDTQTQEPLDRKTKDYLKDGAKLPQLPICVTPPYIDDRLRAQKSCFTVHGKRKDDLTKIFKNRKDPHIAQIEIDDAECDSIMESLTSGGITESLLFPDLEGLARELKYENGF